MSARSALVLLFLFAAACFGEAPQLPPPIEALPPYPPPLPTPLPDGVLPPPAADCPCPPPLRERVAHLTQGLLVPHETAVTVPDWKLRDVEVGRLPDLKLDFVEQQHIVTETKLEVREVEQQVVCRESKPVQVADPCTGHCHTEWVPCDVVKTVKVKVYEPVCIPQVVVVRVPVITPGPDRLVKRVILDEATAPAIERTFDLILNPHKIPFLAPEPDFCAPQLPCSCPAGCGHGGCCGKGH
jgi:hypothetical protein